MSKTKRGTLIHGVAASEHLDSSGERIKIDGIDISSLTKDGTLTWEHKNDNASQVVGKIIAAKKILKLEDCKDEYQKYFWNRIKLPFLYIVGELLDGVGHHTAEEVAAMLRYDKQQNDPKTKKLINFSIEGSRLDKRGSSITKCIARKVTLTLTPCNKMAFAELKEEEIPADTKKVEAGMTGNQEDFSFVQNLMSKGEFISSCQIMKNEASSDILKAIPKYTTSLASIKLKNKPESSKLDYRPVGPTEGMQREGKEWKPKRTFGSMDAPSKLKLGDRIVYPKAKAKTGAEIYGKAPKESSTWKKKEPMITIPAKEMVAEHKKLVHVLETPSHKDDLEEAKEQGKELKEYKRKLKEGTKKKKKIKKMFVPVKANMFKTKKMSNMRKALTAGCAMGVPSVRSQGEAIEKGLAFATKNHAEVTQPATTKSEHLSINLKKSNEDYKKMAASGVALLHPVSIRGAKENQSGIPYHSTIKLFNKEADSPEAIHDIASKRNFEVPNPEHIHIIPDKFNDRFGNELHVLKLHGPEADKIKENHQAFESMGNKTPYEFTPHITVDPEIWNEVQSKGLKTAKEAGIQFHPAELKSGHERLKTYAPQNVDNIPLPSEKKSEDLEIDIFKSDSLILSGEINPLLNRVEDKYFVKKKYLGRLLTILKSNLSEGDSDTTTRYNLNQTIYFDNKDMDAFRDNMEQITPRFKIRIRRYAPNNGAWENVAYVELKIKTEDGVTRKVRIKIPADHIDKLCNGEEIEVDDAIRELNHDIDPEYLIRRVLAVNSAINKYGLKKQLTVSYQRRAYSSKDIRITLDDNLRYYESSKVLDDALMSILGSSFYKKFSKPFKKFREQEYVVLEVKREKESPDWIKDMIEECEAKKVKFSKYCAAVFTYIQTGGKDHHHISRMKKFDIKSVIDNLKNDLSMSNEMAKSESYNIAWNRLLDNFEKKEELLKFLKVRLPELTEKDALILANLVAKSYLNNHSA